MVVCINSEGEVCFISPFSVLFFRNHPLFLFSLSLHLPHFSCLSHLNIPLPWPPSHSSHLFPSSPPCIATIICQSGEADGGNLITPSFRVLRVL